MSQNVDQLAQEVYGPEVKVLSQELGPNLVQVAVVHAQGIPLMVVTARSVEQGQKALVAALNAVKEGV